LKPFDVFICHKKSSGLDYAKHLKAGLEELGLHSFLDSDDIPVKVDGKQEWATIRDQAIKESTTFILIITPGFDLSAEVRKELCLARKTGKQFIYFRHRDLARKIILDLDIVQIDLGKQQQVSFENKEELLRHAYRILVKNKEQPISKEPSTQNTIEKTEKASLNITAGNINEVKCETCLKLISGQPYYETVSGKRHAFDSRECAQQYKKLKTVYGPYFE
jgi:hypothetical protein